MEVSRENLLDGALLEEVGRFVGEVIAAKSRAVVASDLRHVGSLFHRNKSRRPKDARASRASRKKSLIEKLLGPEETKKEKIVGALNLETSEKLVKRLQDNGMLKNRNLDDQLYSHLRRKDMAHLQAMSARATGRRGMTARKNSITSIKSVRGVNVVKNATQTEGETYIMEFDSMTKNCLRELFNSLDIDGNGTIDRDEYTIFYNKLYMVLRTYGHLDLPLLHPAVFEAISEHDWLIDAQGEEYIDHTTFCLCCFQLSEIWAEDTSTQDGYAEFFTALLEQLTEQDVSSKQDDVPFFMRKTIPRKYLSEDELLLGVEGEEAVLEQVMSLRKTKVRWGMQPRKPMINMLLASWLSQHYQWEKPGTMSEDSSSSEEDEEEDEDVMRIRAAADSAAKVFEGGDGEGGEEVLSALDAAKAKAEKKAKGKEGKEGKGSTGGLADLLDEDPGARLPRQSKKWLLCVLKQPDNMVTKLVVQAIKGEIECRPL
jgi:hypothetical protein